jgi:general secretion pathway protein E
VLAPAAHAVIDRFSLDRLAGSREIILYEAVGCPECRGTGYHGRRAIAELLLPNRATDQLILERADDIQIERAAIEGGMRPLFESGLVAAIEGDTTIEEVLRCVRSEAQ